MDEKKVTLKTPGINDVLIKASHTGCKKQVFSFANAVRQTMVASGMDPKAANKIIADSLEAFTPTLKGLNQECMHIVEETIENYINSADKGRDVIGRALRHFCFLQNDDSYDFPGPATDVEAYIGDLQHGVVAQPAVEYFLITIRGSVDGLDPIRSLPLIYGTNLEYVDKKNAALQEILKDYKMDGAEDAPVYWHGVFLDKRARAITLEIVTQTIERIEDTGLDNYLVLLDNLELKYQRRFGRTMMDRPFVLQDVKQLMRILERSKATLESQVGFCCMPGGSRRP